MSDEFGTVNIKARSAERAREIEVIRQHYRRHHEALTAMAADAPTEALAVEYRRLIGEIDSAFKKLDGLDHRPPSDTQPMKTAPGTRPLVTPPAAVAGVDDEPGSAQSRIVLIVIAGLLVLGLIGWLMWRASSDEQPDAAVVESPQVVETVDTTPAPAVQVAAIAVEPSSHDYGAVRKGTRAARQFEIVNTTDQPIKIDVARSECRCLYYDYSDLIPPKGKETLTVTVDGAKAKAGTLAESIRITAESDPSIAASFDVTATIR